MDSITYAVFRAVRAEDDHQRQAEANSLGTVTSVPAGLQPLATRSRTHQEYLGAAGTDLHISLRRRPETVALFMELVAAGYCPPAGLISEGADVILSPGSIHLYAATDRGDAVWNIALNFRPGARPGERGATSWEEQAA